MTVTATADDPIRAEVERRLRAIVDSPLCAPMRLADRVRRCTLRRLGRLPDQLLQPARVVRSLVELIANGGTGGSGSPPLAAVVPMRGRSVSVPAATPAASGTREAELPIEEYESLAASQVVARLTSLTGEELESLRRFEAGHRARRTVLGKIDQLLAVR